MKYHVEFDIDFKRNPYKGVYIVLEGVDGSGKTTQVERLTKYFQSQGKDVVQTREPRKNVGLIGELIQNILHGKTKIPPVAFQYLFSADREIHHTELILPSLKAGKVVISDRCFWSVVPYGLTDRDASIDPNTIAYFLASQSILSMYHQFTLPDYTFYLDLSLTDALRRLRSVEKEREIYESRKILTKIIGGYQFLLNEFPKEFTIVDASQSVEDVTKDILKKLAKKVQ